MAQESWKVARCAPHCVECGKEFSEGHSFVSALNEADGDFVRLDFCPDCWERGETGRFFSFWKTRLRTGGRRTRIDVQVVLDLFERLAESDRPDRVAMRFVLALYLARRKALKLVGVRRGAERSMLQFKRPRSDEEILVEDAELSEDQVSAANERLRELFQSDL